MTSRGKGRTSNRMRQCVRRYLLTKSLNRINRTYLQSLVYATLILTALFYPTQAFCSVDDTTIELLSPAVVESDPGDIVTSSFSLFNNSGVQKSFLIETETPPGWQAFIQPGSVELEPGDSRVVFVSFTIPAHTDAGEYRFSLSAVPSGHVAESLTADIIVDVAGFYYLDIRPGGSNKSDAASGDTLQLVFNITNMGNIGGQVEIEARSYPEWQITIDSENPEFDLGPGQKRPVTITVETPENISAVINHRLSITARIIDGDEVGDEVQTSVTTVIYPHQLSGSIYASLDGKTSFQVSIDDDGETSQLFSIGPMSGDLDSTRRLSFELRNILIEGSSSGFFQQRQRQWALYTDENLGSLEVGDISLTSNSPLIERYLSGQGFEAVIDMEQTNLRFFHIRTPGSRPRENSGFQLGRDVGGNLQLGFTAIHEYDIESDYVIEDEKVQSTNFGLSADLKPDGDTEFTSEAAWSCSNLPGSETALRFTGRHGSEDFSVYGEWLRAGAGFRGGWQDREHRRLNLWWAPTDNMGIWSHYNLTWNNIAREPGSESRNIRNNGIGVSWDVEDLGRVRYSHRLIRDWDSILREHDRLTNLDSVSLSKNWGDLSTTFALEHQLNEYRIISGSEKIDSLRFDLNYRLNSVGYLRFSLTQGWVSQDPAGYGNNTRNITFGGQLRLDEDLTTSLNLHRSSGGILGDRTDINGLITLDLTRGHSLNLRFRDFSSNFGSDTEVALEYSLPTSLQLGNFPRKGSVEGRIFIDESPFKGIPNVRVDIGGLMVLTDDSGYFVFPALDPGQYQLRVDVASLGVGMTSMIDLPAIVTVDAGSSAIVDIPVAESVSVGGRVMMNIPEFRGEPETEWPIADLVVELRAENSSVIRLTDSFGQYLFTDLRPGRYELWLREEYLPVDHEILEPVYYELELMPGDTILDLDFTVREIEHEMIIQDFSNQ